MELVHLLKGVELFDGLDGKELARLAAICNEETFGKGEVIFSQGNAGDKMYIVREGFVEVVVGQGGDGPDAPKAVVNLGAGQVFGEMALVDRGARSATVRSVTERTVVDAIGRDAFNALCDGDTKIGYAVMRNLAADLSFKLRHRNLSRR
ncbi:MAG: cyclic nucleotide-binding domain-containing protein [Chloroflexi bacterium]|nr:cyclic nucleotide-binding domain-containing protein [Chloroflexota bacterium]MBI3764714.1 cyclic nucleotide-binding domain-containing protein [Chloroflexota bacterium]